MLSTSPSLLQLAKPQTLPNSLDGIKLIFQRFRGSHGKTDDIFRSRNSDSNGASDNEEDMRNEGDAENDTDIELMYEAVSPDEAALVHAAKAYRCTLRGRSADSFLVDLPGIGAMTVRLLHILPFDSNRKRMSVVVRHPLTGQVVVLTKGADSAIMNLLETPKGNKMKGRQRQFFL